MTYEEGISRIVKYTGARIVEHMYRSYRDYHAFYMKIGEREITVASPPFMSFDESVEDVISKVKRHVTAQVSA